MVSHISRPRVDLRFEDRSRVWNQFGNRALFHSSDRARHLGRVKESTLTSWYKSGVSYWGHQRCGGEDGRRRARCSIRLCVREWNTNDETNERFTTHCSFGLQRGRHCDCGGYDLAPPSHLRASLRPKASIPRTCFRRTRRYRANNFDNLSRHFRCCSIMNLNFINYNSYDKRIRVQFSTKESLEQTEHFSFPHKISRTSARH